MGLQIGGLDLESIFQVPEEIAQTVQAAVSHAVDIITPNTPNPEVPKALTPTNPVNGQPVVSVGGFKASVEHGLLTAIQIIGVIQSVGFFLPAQYKSELSVLRGALQKVYSWLG